MTRNTIDSKNVINYIKKLFIKIIHNLTRNRRLSGRTSYLGARLKNVVSHRGPDSLSVRARDNARWSNSDIQYESALGYVSVCQCECADQCF